METPHGVKTTVSLARTARSQDGAAQRAEGGRGKGLRSETKSPEASAPPAATRLEELERRELKHVGDASPSAVAREGRDVDWRGNVAGLRPARSVVRAAPSRSKPGREGEREEGEREGRVHLPGLASASTEVQASSGRARFSKH